MIPSCGLPTGFSLNKYTHSKPLRSSAVCHLVMFCMCRHLTRLCNSAPSCNYFQLEMGARANDRRSRRKMAEKEEQEDNAEHECVRRERTEDAGQLDKREAGMSEL